MIYITGHCFRFKGNENNPRIRHIFNMYPNFNTLDVFAIITIRNINNKKSYTFENLSNNNKFNIEFENCEEAENIISNISGSMEDYQNTKNKISNFYASSTD
jgi:hypothetical protein